MNILEWINAGLYAVICYMILRYYLYPIFLYINWRYLSDVDIERVGYLRTPEGQAELRSKGGEQE
jgi:hypothetical protein